MDKKWEKNKKKKRPRYLCFDDPDFLGFFFFNFMKRLIIHLLIVFFLISGNMSSTLL
jgi:hypothetical protein